MLIRFLFLILFFYNSGCDLPDDKKSETWEGSYKSVVSVLPTWPGYKKPGFGSPSGISPEGTGFYFDFTKNQNLSEYILTAFHVIKAENSEVENYYSTFGQILDKDPKRGNLVKTADNAIWINEIIFHDEKIIPTFPIGTTFVSNWLHEFMRLENRLSNVEKKLNLQEKN